MVNVRALYGDYEGTVLWMLGLCLVSVRTLHGDYKTHIILAIRALRGE